MKTLTRQEIVDLLDTHLQTFKSRQEFFDFDIAQYIRERGACGADIRIVSKKYKEYLEYVDGEFGSNDFDDDLFRI